MKEPKRFKLVPDRTPGEREEVVDNLNAMVDAINAFFRSHFRVGDGLTINVTPFGVTVGLANSPGKGGGPIIVTLNEDLGSGGVAEATRDDNDELIIVHEFMGFYGDPIPADTKVWVHKTKKKGDTEKQWYLLNAPGEPGCGSEQDGDCECSEDDENDE